MSETNTNLQNESNFYLRLILKEVPRILGLLDRNESSSTYGCFDRSYWKYKIKDYYNARFQEAAYTLALLYSYESNENPYYKDDKIRAWAIAACKFWATHQYRNGSFDEYMPHENSHVATAFSSLAIAEAYHLLGIKDEVILGGLKSSSEWLNKNDDLVVINHDAGCVPFFYTMYKITKQPIYQSYAKRKLKKVLECQSKEGWFNEYGGADIGYQSYTIYFLAKYYKLSNDKSVFEPLKLAIEFFSYFIHPDGTMGGNYGSRDTNFIMPAGFEIMSNEIPFASEIAINIRKSLDSKKIVGPYSFDDRFICEEAYMYLDFVEHKLVEKKILPIHMNDFFKLFYECGLLVIKKKDQYLICNVKKSAIGILFNGSKIDKNIGVHVFKKNTDSDNNKNNTCYATYGKSEYIYLEKENTITVKSNFYKFKDKRLKPIAMIGIRVFSIFGLGSILKEVIRKALIFSSNKTDYSYTLTVSFSKNIAFVEHIDKRISKNTKQISDFSPIYSTSVGFYNKN